MTVDADALSVIVFALAFVLSVFNYGEAAGRAGASAARTRLVAQWTAAFCVFGFLAASGGLRAVVGC